MVNDVGMRKLVICGIVAATTVLAAGCGSSENSADNAVPPSSAASAGECRPMVPFSSDERGAAAGQGAAAQQVAESVSLPAGVSIVTGRLSTDSDHPDEFAVAIDLCGGDISTADELKPVATRFAKAYKAAPVGDRVLALYVAHYASYTTTGTAGGVKIKDPDFQMHLWNGKPSEQAELDNWEVVGR